LLQASALRDLVAGHQKSKESAYGIATEIAEEFAWSSKKSKREVEEGLVGNLRERSQRKF